MILVLLTALLLGAGPLAAPAAALPWQDDPDNPDARPADDAPAEDAAPAEPADIVAARQRVERSPGDAQALAALVTVLVDHERADEALHWVVLLGAQTGDEQFIDTWTDRLDPLAAERREALTAAAARQRELAGLCADKTHHVTAAALYDGAATLGAHIGAGSDAVTEALAGRAALRDSRRATKRLVEHAVPLYGPGETAPPHPEPADDRAEHTARSRHYEVRTRLGSDFAEQVADYLETLHDQLEKDFDDTRKRDRVEVIILQEVAAFESVRPGGGSVVSAWSGSWHDTQARKLVVLDPRVVGEPLPILWGLLAREAARGFVTAMSRPPPLWIEDGLSMTYEGVRRRADGSVDLDGVPWHRMEQVALSRRGQGLLRPEIAHVIEMDRPLPEQQIWAWALVAYLRQAVDEDGELLWADRFDALLDDYRHAGAPARGFEDDGPDPLALFKLRILPKGDVRASVGNLAQLEGQWNRWVQHHGLVGRGKLPAVRAEIVKIEQLADRGHLERAVRRVRRLLAARPDSREGWALMADVERRRRETDAALLATLNEVACTPPDEEDRWEPVERINSRMAADFAEADAALRTDVRTLVGRYRSKDFPRAALRLVDAALAAAPRDTDLADLRARLVDEHELDAIVIRRWLEPGDMVDRGYGDKSLWLEVEDTLAVQCSDRLNPTMLKGIARVQAPCEVAVDLEFTGFSSDASYDFAGFTLGAARPEEGGEWGLFCTPSGRVELATQGRMEWPSESVGRTAPRRASLRLRLREDTFEVIANDKLLTRRPLGTRTADGWVSLFARHVDVTFRNLVVEVHHTNDPPSPWFGRGRP